MSIHQEEWRPVPDTNGRYEVSNLGRVRNARKGNVLKLGRHKQGYSLVQICHPDYPSGRLQRSLHSLVAEVFIGPRPMIEGKLAVVCHNDGDPTHNAASNLRYDTQAANMLEAWHQHRHRSCAVCGAGNSNAKLAEAAVIDIRARWESGEPLKTIAQDHGIGVAHVSAIGLRRRWAWLPERA